MRAHCFTLGLYQETERFSIVLHLQTVQRVYLEYDPQIRPYLYFIFIFQRNFYTTQLCIHQKNYRMLYNPHRKSHKIILMHLTKTFGFSFKTESLAEFSAKTKPQGLTIEPWLLKLKYFCLVLATMFFVLYYKLVIIC